MSTQSVHWSALGPSLLVSAALNSTEATFFILSPEYFRKFAKPNLTMVCLWKSPLDQSSPTKSIPPSSHCFLCCLLFAPKLACSLLPILEAISDASNFLCPQLVSLCFPACNDVNANLKWKRELFPGCSCFCSIKLFVIEHW